MELNPAVGDGGPPSDEDLGDEDHEQGQTTYVYESEYLPAIRTEVPLFAYPANYLDTAPNNDDISTSDAKQIDRTRSNHSFHDIVSSENRRRQSTVNEQGDRVDTVGDDEPVGVFKVTLAMASPETEYPDLMIMIDLLHQEIEDEGFVTDDGKVSAGFPLGTPITTDSDGKIHVRIVLRGSPNYDWTFMTKLQLNYHVKNNKLVKTSRTEARDPEATYIDMHATLIRTPPHEEGADPYKAAAVFFLPRHEKITEAEAAKQDTSPTEAWQSQHQQFIKNQLLTALYKGPWRKLQEGLGERRICIRRVKVPGHKDIPESMDRRYDTWTVGCCSLSHVDEVNKTIEAVFSYTDKPTLKYRNWHGQYEDVAFACKADLLKKNKQLDLLVHCMDMQDDRTAKDTSPANEEAWFAEQESMDYLMVIVTGVLSWNTTGREPDEDKKRDEGTMQKIVENVLDQALADAKKSEETTDIYWGLETNCKDPAIFQLRRKKVSQKKTICTYRVHLNCAEAATALLDAALDIQMLCGNRQKE